MRNVFVAVSCLFVLLACQSTEDQTSVLESATTSPTQQTADTGQQSDEASANTETAQTALVANQSSDGSQALVSGDTILTFRPPPIGSKATWRLAGSRGVETIEATVVSHDETFQGQRVWVTDSKEGKSYWSYGYSRVGRTFPDGSLREVSTSSREDYRFPMKPGDEWTTSYRRTNYKPDRTRNMTGKVQVAGWENVTTPAGTFKTMKIVRKYAAGSQKWTNTSWFAPEYGLDIKGNDTWPGGKFSWTVVKISRP